MCKLFVYSADVHSDAQLFSYLIEVGLIPGKIQQWRIKDFMLAASLSFIVFLSCASLCS